MEKKISGATDDDARLMLAANYLFGGYPAGAMDVLEHEDADRLRDDPAAILLLEAARRQPLGK